LCAVLEGRVLGYIGAWEIIDEAHITTVAVNPEYKGRGIAKALLVAVLERCYEAKIKYITLEVRVSNKAAIGLYEKFGFKSLGLRKKYYQNDGEDALIMWTQNIFDKSYKEMFEKNKLELAK
jgi:ribosomal-protein-alanine N-acetyltransferase